MKCAKRSQFIFDLRRVFPSSPWQFVWQRFLVHPRATALLFLFSILGASLETFAIGLAAALIEGLVPGAGLTTQVPKILSGPLNFLDGMSVPDRMVYIGLLLLCVSVLKAALSICNSFMVVYLKNRTALALRGMLLSRILAGKIGGVTRLHTGSITSSVIVQADQIGTLVMVVALIASRILPLAALAWMMISLSWQFSIASLILLSIPAFIVRYLSGKVRELNREKVSRQQADTSHLIETVSGWRTIRMAVQEELRHSEFMHLSRRYYQIVQKTTALENSAPAVGEGLGMAVVASLLIGAALLLGVNDPQKLSGILLVMVIMMRALPQVSALNGIRMKIESVAGVYDKLKESVSILGDPEEMKAGARVLDGPAHLAFESVTFTYPGAAHPAVASLCLQLPPQGITALIGSSGAGKSTVVDLILGFIEPNQGQVTLNGESINKFDRRQWRGHIGYVGQDIFLFDDTIRSNITLNRPDATDEEIESAARSAGIHDFIMTLPDGYGATTGERGGQLSGGQRQRIAIARALLGRPSILILDEATSALDAQTEADIINCLTTIGNKIPILLITHRLAAASRVDTTIVLDQGRIVGVGSHEKLLAEGCAVYEKLWAAASADQLGKSAGSTS